MSRFTSILVGTFVAAFAATGCRVSVETKTRFIEPEVVREDTADWGGGPIDIQIQGVGLSVNGGVKVIADPSATKVRATARMLAMAFGEEKANADQSIIDAKETFTIANDGHGVTVRCGHGKTHGSSSGGESGCEYVEIVVPAGSVEDKLDLKVLSGNGTLRFALQGATITSVAANSAHGDIEASLPATQGATISLVAEGARDITAQLPADFAADEIILQAEPSKIDLGSFTDAKNGADAGGRGEAGAGLKLLKLTSKESGRRTGTIALR